MAKLNPFYSKLLVQSEKCRKKADDCKRQAERMPTRAMAAIFRERERMWLISAYELENMASLAILVEDLLEQVAD